MFSIATTTDTTRPAVRFDYDVGVGERTFQSDVANQPEQRLRLRGFGRAMEIAASRFFMARFAAARSTSPFFLRFLAFLLRVGAG